MGNARRHPATPVVVLLSAAAVWAACGGGDQNANPPPQASASAAPPPATSPPEPPPSASASASAAPEPPKRAPRMAVSFQDAVAIEHTFGSDPAKIEIGEKEIATLRIPADAITQAANVTFKIDKQGKTTGVAVGKVYRIFAIRPPAEAFVEIPTGSDPFKLSMPAGGKKDANLAIGEVTKDAKGNDKIVWTIVAPTKIDDVTNTAHFELPAIKNVYLHVTTKAPTGDKK